MYLNCIRKTSSMQTIRIQLGFRLRHWPLSAFPTSMFEFLTLSMLDSTYKPQTLDSKVLQNRFSNPTLKSQIPSCTNSIRKRTKKHIHVASVYGPFPIWFCPFPDGQNTTAKAYWSSKSSAFEQFIKINMPKNWYFRSIALNIRSELVCTGQGTQILYAMLTKQL